MYFPQLIEAGMVYKAIPPLYSIRVNGKEKYFTEQIDIIKYVQGLFLSNHKMDTIKKQSLKPKDVRCSIKVVHASNKHHGSTKHDYVCEDLFVTDEKNPNRKKLKSLNFNVPPL